MGFRDLIQTCQEQITTHEYLGAGTLELRVLVPARAKDFLRNVRREQSTSFLHSEDLTEVTHILGVEIIYTEQDTLPLVVRLATL
jgi:hypothetical protein